MSAGSRCAVKLVDLDELERKARGALDTTSNMGARIAEHVLAHTPPVTLALIARIRELEGALEESARHTGDLGIEHRALLEKGAVLP